MARIGDTPNPGTTNEALRQGTVEPVRTTGVSSSGGQPVENPVQTPFQRPADPKGLTARPDFRVPGVFGQSPTLTLNAGRMTAREAIGRGEEFGPQGDHAAATVMANHSEIDWGN